MSQILAQADNPLFDFVNYLSRDQLNYALGASFREGSALQQFAAFSDLNGDVRKSKHHKRNCAMDQENIIYMIDSIFVS